MVHIRGADGVVGSSFHGKEQPQQSGSGDSRPHEGQVDEAVIKPGLRRSMKVSTEVALVEGQDQDKVPFNGDPVSSGKRLVKWGQQVVSGEIRRQ